MTTDAKQQFYRFAGFSTSLIQSFNKYRWSTYYVIEIVLDTISIQGSIEDRGFNGKVPVPVELLSIMKHLMM